MNASENAGVLPDLRPSEASPGLLQLSGCGLLFCGHRRSKDEPDGRIATRCLCLFFLPLLAISAYRVMPDRSGNRVLGRSRLSWLAWSYNLLIVAAASSFFAAYSWTSYTSTPEYQAMRRVEQAEFLAREGRQKEAARLLADVAMSDTSRSSEAAQKLVAVVDSATPEGRDGDLPDLLKIAIEVFRATRWPESAGKLYERGMSLANRKVASAPREAVALLDSVASFSPQPDVHAASQLELLQKLNAAHPDELEWASRLVAIYHEKGDSEDDRCEALLIPHRAKLGDSDNAKLLGQIDIRKGRIPEALALLQPYIKTRIQRLHDAQKNLENGYKGAQERIVNQLRTGNRGEFPVAAYNRADDIGKQELLQKYVMDRVQLDGGVRAAQSHVVRESEVVPVALDVGMILLQRAQSQADPEAKKADLDASEECFLSLSKATGDSDEVRLSLAQVYYWQGKSAEGKDVIDTVLASSNRDPKVLLAVADIYRKLGSQTEGCALAEEAFNGLNEPKLKEYAALQRGLMTVDDDERILWLRRAASDSPGPKAILETDLARQAMRKGDNPEAIDHVRESIKLYDGMPESASVLNNKGMALIELADLTVDAQARERGLAALEKAVAIDGSNSLTLANGTSTFLQAGLRDVIGSSIDLGRLQKPADYSFLRYLYRDRAGHDAIARKVAEQPRIARALALSEKVMLLAPRRPESYEQAARLRFFLRDTDALKGILKKLDSVELDTTAEVARQLKGSSGEKAEELAKDLKPAISQAENRLAHARTPGGDTTFAVAAGDLVLLKLAGQTCGLEPDPDELVKLAEEAWAAAPSIATRQSLMNTLLFRAERTVASRAPDYAAMVTRSKFSCFANWRVALAIEFDPKLRAAFVADPDVKRTIELLREWAAADPVGASSGSAWCLLHSSFPDDAAAMVKQGLDTDLERTDRAIRAKLSPVDLSDALEAAILLRIGGRGADSLAALKALEAKGVPLPMSPEVLASPIPNGPSPR